ncbi:MAG TPA: kynureninase [Candidatus Limnocylindrales bacterium]
MTLGAITERESARAFDAADPLAGFRERFLVPEGDLVYLDGNSLGRPPLVTRERLERMVVDEWAGDLIRGWDRWLDLPERVGDLIADTIIGARRGEVIVSDSTTVNLFKLASAALDAMPDRRTVVIARDEFPTDRYVLEGLARARGLTVRWIDDDPLDGPTVDDVAGALDRTVALVVLSLVNYRSAAIADLPGITARARDAGAVVLWDLSHAAGSITVQLDSDGADLAVGCTYKYLNGGPGAPAFLYLRRDLQERLRNPIQGWFGQRDQFLMGPTYQPAPGIRSWLTGTAGIPALVAVEEGVRLVADGGLERIRAKGIALTEYAIRLHDAWLAPLGFTLGSPRDPSRRGAHVAIRHPRASELTTRLIDRGVIPDFREPDSIRLGMSPLTTSFDDVWRGLSALRSLVAEDR